MPGNLSPCPNDETLARQEMNRRTVEDYMAVKGPDRIEERLALFAEDGMREICSTRSCMPERTVGKGALRQKMLRLQKKWADFSYSNVKVYRTPNPETFIVECDGRGLIKNPMFTSPHEYENHFFIIFVVRDARISLMKEFMNPMKLEQAFWNPVPDRVM
jgi:ketosteroid isomerase-like protein